MCDSFEEMSGNIAGAGDGMEEESEDEKMFLKCYTTLQSAKYVYEHLMLNNVTLNSS